MTFLRIDAIDLEKVINALSAVEEGLEDAATVAAVEEGHRLLKWTKHRVPVRTTQLQKSGRVEGPDVASGQTTVDIVYGGPAGAGENDVDVDYAVIVHEDLEAVHFFGRTAKYVENVINEELANGRTQKNMMRVLSREMGWGG